MPVLVAGVVATCTSAVGILYYPIAYLGLSDPLPDDAYVTLAWALNVLRILVPFGIYAGILRLRDQRTAVGRVFVEVGEAPTPRALERALAQALEDPSLRVYGWDR